MPSKKRFEDDDSLELPDSPEGEDVEVQEAVDEVELAGPDEETDDDDELTRKQKRSARGHKFREEYEARLKEKEDQLQQLNGQISEMRGYFQAFQRQQPQQDPLEQELQNVRKQRERVWEYYQAKRDSMTPEQLQEAQREAEALNEYESRIVARREYMRLQQSQQQDPQAGVRAYIIQREAGDIVQAAQQNPNMLAYGQAEFARLATQAGSSGNYEELVRQAAENTRKAFNMPTRVAQGTARPSPPRRTTAGIPAGGNHHSGAPVTRVRMDANSKKLAESMYPNLPPERAHQKWANGPGKRAAERLASGRGL